MNRTKSQILTGLDPTDPASIQALIEFHRRTFGGFVMEDKPDADKPEDKPADKPDDKDGKPDGDKPLGPGGEKALKAERDARTALEAEVKQMKTDAEARNKALLEAFGVKSDDAKSEDAVTALQEKFTNLQHELLFERVARENKITDADDLALLKDIRDESAMTKLAGRLKPAEKQEEPSRRQFPRQDSSQGKGGSTDTRPTSVKAVQEERAAARAAKEQQRSA